MSILRLLRVLRDDTAGNTLAICAAAIIPLTAVIGSGLDISVAYMTRAKLQNACDAGALAGRQLMQGTTFNAAVEAEARKFFDFNFPEGTSGSTDLEFKIKQDTLNRSQLLGTASAAVPTSIMRIFGYEQLPISVNCDATRDMGHNDIVLVLDVTGSMNCPPGVPGGCNGVEQTGSKISRLRTGAMGLYRALDSGDGSITRYGIVPYSHTVNVGRSLRNRDIVTEQPYNSGQWYSRPNRFVAWQERAAYTPLADSPRHTWDFVDGPDRLVHINEATWNIGRGGGSVGGNTERFRVSGDGCIEERRSVGSNPSQYRIEDTVSRADVDQLPANANDSQLQFGRYDPGVQLGHTQDGCPSESTRLRQYANSDAFRTAINLATARVTGGTYHDVGMLWGTRFVSRTGFFAGNNFNQGDNITEIDGVPVNTHIVFMTDGELDTGDTLYSAHGVERWQGRTKGSGDLDTRHLSRFRSVCNLARGMGVTIWVIALDVNDTGDIEPCATTSDHFFVSDGSDLEQVFEKIGQGIGNLRLTR